MHDERRWWDGPWPWLVYLPTYGIPWLWMPPSAGQLLLSMIVLAFFLSIYLGGFRAGDRGLRSSVAAMMAVAIASIPIGGGWSCFALYAAMQSAKIRPRPIAIRAVILCILAFVTAGVLSRQPIIWWLPSLTLPALIAGATFSREAFYDRTRALLATQEEVRRLAGMAERERMARDLHDVIGRTLTLVALKADLVAKIAGRDGETAASEARTIADQARAGLADIRVALAGRASGSLAQELVASRDALADAGITAEIHGDTTPIPPDAGAILAMTLREAITNVIRHTDARRCRIEVAMLHRMATLAVSDDGTAAAIVEGNGLTGMRQRLIAAGGVLTISTDQPGVHLLASVPA